MVVVINVFCCMVVYVMLWIVLLLFVIGCVEINMVWLEVCFVMNVDKEGWFVVKILLRYGWFDRLMLSFVVLGVYISLWCVLMMLRFVSLFWLWKMWLMKLLYFCCFMCSVELLVSSIERSVLVLESIMLICVVVVLVLWVRC